MTDNTNGTYTINCEDGTTSTIRDGVQGATGSAGADGSGCNVTDNANGTYTISCDEGTMVSLSDGVTGPAGVDGVDGSDGTSCTATTIAEGIEVSCGGSVVDTLVNGTDATSCTTQDLGDSLTVSCPDGTTSSWAKATCGLNAYSPETQFCYLDEVYDRCGGLSFDPLLLFCSADLIYSKCNELIFTPTTQFCSAESIFSKCNGLIFDPIVEFCDSDIIYPICNSDASYDPTTSFCDIREGGQLYRYIAIGSQTWMAENLNYATSGSCYGGDASSCEIYGRLYTWDAAMGGASASSASPSGVKGICPDNWHLPSEAEWAILINSVDINNGADGVGKSLKAIIEGGTDAFSFGGLYAGYRYNGMWFNETIWGRWWNATEFNDDYASAVVITDGSDDLNWYEHNTKTTSYSIRCVMD